MDATARAEQALIDYCAEPGRSALIRIDVGGRVWEEGVAAGVKRPAASLLKLAVAIAAEEAIADGSLDAARRTPVAELGAVPGDRSVLDLLDPARDIDVVEALGLMLGASDNPCARRLVELVGLAR
ncbi:MAG: serine hydrolase, partial [Actinomycetota bacterium]